MENWKETTLGEVVDIEDGDRGFNYPKNDEFSSKGFCLFLNTKNVSGKKFFFGERMFVTREKNSQLRKGKLQRGDYVLTTRGTVGNSAYYSDDIPFENIRINSGMVILRAKRKNIVDEIYLGCYLGSRIFDHQVRQLTSGSAQPQLPIRDLRTFQIVVPPIEEQKKIAGVLGSLDDKIELLREENKTLEATAQIIFKEWFVNFNFPANSTARNQAGGPIAAGKPYKASSGKMIDSELGEIPDGWRVGKIKDVIDILSGFAFQSTSFSEEGKYKLVTIKNVQDRNFVFDKTDKISKIPEKMPNYCQLDSGDILLSLTGNVGRVCLVIGSDFLLNQRVAKLKPKNDIDYAFSYLLFLQDSIFSLLQSTASGTAQQNLSPIQTKEIETIIPDRETLRKFGLFANPMIGKINDNNSQIQTISRLRDTLLPKLMNGELKIN